MPRFHRTYRDDPTSWKVTFRLSTPRRRPVRERPSRAGYQPSEKRPCRNLALRIEALRRVIVRHDDYVLRYARRLARMEAARFRAVADLIDLIGPHPETDQSPATQPDAAPRSAKLIEPG